MNLKQNLLHNTISTIKPGMILTAQNIKRKIPGTNITQLINLKKALQA